MKSEKKCNFGEAKFVGLAGALNAGKDTGAEHLAENHGFLHVSTGDLLREEARRNGLDTDRNTLIDLGIKLRQDYGSQGALIIKGMERWQEQRDRYVGGLVVTGMRAIGEAQEVLTQGGTLLFVDVSMAIGYRRMMARQRDDETMKTFEQFAEHAMVEMEGDPNDLTRPNLGAIKKIAHHVLMNNHDTPAPFIAELDETLGLRHV